MYRKLIAVLARFGVVVKRKPLSIHRTARVVPRLGALRTMLSDELAERVDLAHEPPDSELYRRFRDSHDVHKWHHYLQIYEDRLGPLRDRPIRMLEIGVFRGGSLEMWKGWLHADSVIVGLDIDPGCRQYEQADRGMHVRIGDQSDAEFLAQVVEEFGPFDVILDDGGHTTTQMITSFNHLFRGGLVEGGQYLVEDTHTNWWPGYVDSKMTFIEFAKALAELLHAPYFDAWSIDPYTYTEGEGRRTMNMSWIEAWLHSVTFYDSIVCFEKRRRTLPVHELRK